MKMAQKHENKLELEYGNLERKLISKSKWNDRAARQSLCIKPTTSTNGGADVSSIDNWLQHEREKAQKIIQSKQSANEHIRRFSVSPNAKPTGGSRRKASTTQPMTYVRKISTTT
ncbi:unnamed protein product [Didymodactylos carnosus]|uniref:Uncharacterized protein n=1 Tax=Didymodactylos carnosus TaxID=1234261 RepID=A0A814CQH9_9BILA|nr:unnamed protein product [Didymodactylos carnosus]CAF1162626.1 unnamed protein product [Didymodactylos carnosus]CAF3719717.1 unnamed protein product [Didymodactylos carnosus]CAF3974308.1 unnamed protein product [Didymodactylos carnosus]